MMWYYEQDHRQIGPINDPEFLGLVQTGVIQPATLVWREGMEAWKPYASLAGTSAALGAAARADNVPVREAGDGRAYCVQCGAESATSEMVQLGGAWVCANCKSVYAQRMLEGARLPLARRYGGFWIRFLAVLLDGIILAIAGMTISIPMQIIFTPTPFSSLYWGVFSITSSFQLLVAMTYEAFFLVRFGATPGKMACSLEVIRVDGSRLTTGLAIGRYFAKNWLNALTLFIGFIMAGVDDEKRGLHDRICDTRVVYK